MRKGPRIVVAVITALVASVFTVRPEWPLGGVLLAGVAGFVAWFLIGSFWPVRR